MSSDFWNQKPESQKNPKQLLCPLWGSKSSHLCIFPHFVHAPLLCYYFGTA